MDLTHVRTARLVADRPLLRDAEQLHAVVADERVVPWLWPDGPPSLARVRSMLVHDAAHWKRHGWGPWVVRDAATGTLLGRVGLEHTTVGGRPEVEVAWALSAERWGEGLATEIAAEAVRVAFDVVGLPDLVAFTLVGNTRSRAVMERLGFRYERDVEHAGLPHVLYRISREGGTPSG
jgi:RimJ/RimL family protein N-acetyltransferase